MNLVTKDNCPPCTKLKNMLNQLHVKYNEFSIDDLPDNYKDMVTSYPTVFHGTNLLFDGAPGSIESLKQLLVDRGVV